MHASYLDAVSDELFGRVGGVLVCIEGITIELRGPFPGCLLRGVQVVAKVQRRPPNHTEDDLLLRIPSQRRLAGTLGRAGLCRSRFASTPTSGVAVNGTTGMGLRRSAYSGQGCPTAAHNGEDTGHVARSTPHLLPKRCPSWHTAASVWLAELRGLQAVMIGDLDLAESP